jgi:hypothetical protein
MSDDPTEDHVARGRPREAAEGVELPWLGIFEVRRLLEPHVNVEAGFDVHIDHQLARAAETGSLNDLQKELHRWLQAALIAAGAEGLSGKDAEGRARYVDQLLQDYLAQRPATRWRPPGTGSKG